MHYWSLCPIVVANTIVDCIVFGVLVVGYDVVVEVVEIGDVHVCCIIWCI